MTYVSSYYVFTIIFTISSGGILPMNTTVLHGLHDIYREVTIKLLDIQQVWNATTMYDCISSPGQQFQQPIISVHILHLVQLWRFCHFI